MIYLSIYLSIRLSIYISIYLSEVDLGVFEELGEVALGLALVACGLAQYLELRRSQDLC